MAHFFFFLQSWFFPDLLSTVPIDKVVELIIGGGSGESTLGLLYDVAFSRRDAQ